MGSSLLLLVVLFFGGVLGAPRVRQSAPDFSAAAVLPDLSFGTVSLASLTANQHWTVLLFFPAAWTFVCPTELIAFSEASASFAARNVSLSFVSVDTKHSLLAWLQQPRREGGLGLGFRVPLISDVTRQICLAYDVLVDDHSEDHGLALRATFIIDPSRTIRHASVSDLPVGRSVEETMRLVSAFQYADSHPGKGCPANWRSANDPTIITDPFKSKEYFKAKWSKE